MLTAQEQAELDALEAEFNPQAKRLPAAPSRQPGDLNIKNIQVLSPEEEAELAALENEFAQRPVPGTPTDEGIISQLGNVVDQYSGAASVRRGIGTLQDTGDIRQAFSAAVDQYGQHPSMAPTGKEIAEKAGLSTENQVIQRNPMQVADEARAFGRPVPSTQEVVSPAAVAGMAIDVAADPMNLIPLIPFAKVAQKSGQAGKAFLKGSAKAAMVADSFTGVPLVKAGEILDAGAKASAETIKKTKTALVKAFKPGLADDYNDIARIAAENDIPQELLNKAHKYGENSVVSRYERSNAEGPLGGLEKHEQLVHAVSDATENKIRKISKVESIPDDIEAGAILRQAHDDGVDNFFNQMGETYNNAVKMAPDMRLDKKSQIELNNRINEWEKWARGRLTETKDLEKVIDSGAATKGQLNKATGQMLEAQDANNKAITNVQRSQAKEVLIASQRMRNAVASGDVNQVYSIMREVGEIAFKSKNSLAELPSDVRKFQEMYFANQRALTETIRKSLGNEFADKLIENNSAMSKFFTHRGNIAPVIGNKSLSDEKVFHSLIMKGDKNKIDAIQSIVSPEAFDKLRATFLHRVINPSADGVINFKAARKELHKLKQSGKLKLMMSPREIIELDEVLRLGERGGLGVLSTSGTGASSKLSNLTGTIKDHLANETLINQIENSTRANYVEVPRKTGDGKAYVELIKKPSAEKQKSGIQQLRESSPISNRQAAKGAQVKSVQERNERIQKLKQMRGL